MTCLSIRALEVFLMCLTQESNFFWNCSKDLGLELLNSREINNNSFSAVA